MKEPKGCLKSEHRRISTTFTDMELNEIDKWGFARHIRDRSEVIRRLVSQALNAEAKTAADEVPAS